jgi:hypothetical protein
VGIISGSPANAGTKTFSLMVTDQSGEMLTKKLKIKVYKLLGILTKSLRKARVGRKYTASLKSTGGKKPYGWSIVLGDLPIGIFFDSITGRLTGIPAEAGVFDIIFRSIDTLGDIAEKELILQIDP